MSELPREIGVFPLPDVVLFPGALLPLHVFEPCYRSLVEGALATHRQFVLAVLKPGRDDSAEVHDIGCMGKIVKHAPHADGRSDLIVRGGPIVNIEEFVASSPFRVARVKVRPEEDCFVTAPGAKQRVQELHDLLELACPGSLVRLQEALPVDGTPRGGLELLHVVAMHLPVDVALKLEWLACPGSLSRWKCIRKKLCELASARSLGKVCLERYSDLSPDDPQAN
jgi:Lon protease-like protein